MCASPALVSRYSPAEWYVIEVIRAALELRYGYPVVFKTDRIIDQTHPSHDRKKRRTLRFNFTYDFKTDRTVTTVRRPFRASGALDLHFDVHFKKWLVGSDPRQNKFAFYDNNRLISCIRFIPVIGSPRPVDEYAVPAFAQPMNHGCGRGIKDREIQNLKED